MAHELVRATHSSAAAPPAPRTLVPCLLRPFERRDLAEVPRGWSVGPPDFVAIGCGRAGSTWWWRLIESHPRVVPNRLHQKELHYFVHFGWEGPNEEQRATYNQAFARPEGSLCGDGSFNYLAHPLAIAHLARTAPRAKLLAIVRNPVERMVSNYDMFLRRRLRWLGLEGERAHVTARVSLWDEAVTACRLADGFRAVLEHWPREDLLVLQYERCKDDPRGELARTYRFLGLDEQFLPEDLARPVNREPHELPEPDARARRDLAQLFRADVDQVCAMFPEVERSLWRDFV
ncbi:MAG: sulfotransferase [Planctomycetes bacterium]|nr:sulfotransferase [Planctomycetota bacterium]